MRHPPSTSIPGLKKQANGADTTSRPRAPPPPSPRPLLFFLFPAHLILFARCSWQNKMRNFRPHITQGLLREKCEFLCKNWVLFLLRMGETILLRITSFSPVDTYMLYGRRGRRVFSERLVWSLEELYAPTQKADCGGKQ